MSELIGENKLLASLILIAFASLIRWLVIRYLQKRPLDEELMPKRWINRVKNITHLFIFVGLIIIWLFELRYLALSIAAFAVSLVIATREYIQCVLGSLYQTGTKMFVIGDWIKVGNSCGEVVRNDWMSTTLLEVSTDYYSYGYTGRTLIIPNNLFITGPVANLNFMRRYVNHSFVLVRESKAVDIGKIKALIIERASHHCQPFAEVAQRYSTLIENRLGVTIGGPQPSVRVSTTNLGKNQFEVSIFCPTFEAISIEQRLIEEFFVIWDKEVSLLENQIAENLDSDHEDH